MSATWTDADSAAAEVEGWDVFHLGGDVWELARLDDADLFPDDLAAWEHVVERAAAGSALHRKALPFIPEV